MDCINNRTITEEILEACLYSVNKRTKNHRDRAREAEYRYRYDYYGVGINERMKMEEMYNMKDTMLETLSPVCVLIMLNAIIKYLLRPLMIVVKHMIHIKSVTYCTRLVIIPSIMLLMNIMKSISLLLKLVRLKNFMTSQLMVLMCQT